MYVSGDHSTRLQREFKSGTPSSLGTHLKHVCQEQLLEFIVMLTCATSVLN